MDNVWGESRKICADLHLHTTASDGSLPTVQVLERAMNLGLTHVAITDHDSVEGLQPFPGLTVIPGVELSCGGEKEIHILGYGVNPEHPVLLEYSEARRRERLVRAEQMVMNLSANGIEISLDRVLELAHGVVARPHVARALVERGYARSVPEAFEKFLVPGRCGYVPRPEISVAHAISALNQAGGIAVLAHPMQLKFGSGHLEELVREWKGQGLAGIEVYHPSAQNSDTRMLRNLADSEGLLITGGSDFHGPGVRNTEIGEALDRWTSMEEDVEKLLERVTAWQP